MRPGALALLVAGGACGALGACRGKPAADDAGPAAGSASAAPRPAVPDQLSGTLTLDGKPLAMVKCRPGRDTSIYVDLVTSAGVLRYVPYDPQLFWNPRSDSTERGAAMPCRLRRSWGGATRPDGTTYFRGQLIFSCKSEAGTLAGDVTLDCGNISPIERKLLDAGRQQKLDEQELDELKGPARP